MSRLSRQCAHEAQCVRDSVADLAQTVPPVAREPTFRHIALTVAESQRAKTPAVSGDALFSLQPISDHWRVTSSAATENVRE